MENSVLIKNVYNNLLRLSIFGSITAMANMVIDAIVTGRFLGTDAVTASGLISPIGIMVALVCNLLGPGLSVLCTRYVGMADKKRVDQVFGIVSITALITGSIFALAIFFGSDVLASLVCAELNDPVVTGLAADYLKYYSFGIVFNSLSMCIAQVMLLDNDMFRALAFTLTTLITNVILDLLNVLVFYGGMKGMALATSISTICGFVVLISHFTKKDRILHFNFKGLMLSDLKEGIVLGMSTSITQLCAVVKGLVFNHVLASSQPDAVAAFAVANSANTLVICIITSVLTTTSTLTSMFYGEVDRGGLERVMDVALKNMKKLAIALSLLYFIFAGPIAKLFLGGNEMSVSTLAATFLRFLTVQFLFMSVSFPVSGGFMGTGRSDLGNAVAVLREGVYPVVMVAVLGTLFNTPGFEAGIVLSGVLCFVTTLILSMINNKKMPHSGKDMLILPEEFSVDPDDLMEVAMKDMDDVAKTSEEVRAYCIRKGMDRRTALFFSLFVEEMAGNTVQHGFKGIKDGSVEMRLVYQQGRQTIRLRDNGVPFDPVRWLEMNHNEDILKGAGIRMIVGMSKDIQYIPALQLNNLIVRIEDERPVA